MNGPDIGPRFRWVWETWSPDYSLSRKRSSISRVSYFLQFWYSMFSSFHLAQSTVGFFRPCPGSFGRLVIEIIVRPRHWRNFAKLLMCCKKQQHQDTFEWIQSFVPENDKQSDRLQNSWCPLALATLLFLVHVA